MPGYICAIGMKRCMQVSVGLVMYLRHAIGSFIYCYRYSAPTAHFWWT